MLTINLAEILKSEENLEKFIKEIDSNPKSVHMEYEDIDIGQGYFYGNDLFIKFGDRLAFILVPGKDNSGFIDDGEIGCIPNSETLVPVFNVECSFNV